MEATIKLVPDVAAEFNKTEGCIYNWISDGLIDGAKKEVGKTLLNGVVVNEKYNKFLNSRTAAIMSGEHETCTIKAAALYHKCSPETIYIWIKKGKLDIVKIQRRSILVVMNEKYYSMRKQQGRIRTHDYIKAIEVREWYKYKIISFKDAAKRKRTSVQTIKNWIGEKLIRMGEAQKPNGALTRGVVVDERFTAINKKG